MGDVRRRLFVGSAPSSKSDVCFWHFSDIEVAGTDVRFGLLSDISAKVLNSTEDAHLTSMSSFEGDEHLQAPLHSRLAAECDSGDRARVQRKNGARKAQAGGGAPARASA
jgi:hypothetical protein